jgi:CubicO group peptidase (beta-lactamase class C family)
LRAQNSIDEIVETYMLTSKIPGLSLAILQDDSIKTLKAYGLASIQNDCKTDISTTFELASLTKQFTATAILKLQQEGKLSVNDYLYQYFPECPEHWKTITIKHLLWHTSGLPGMFPHDNYKHQSFTGYAKMTSIELDLLMKTNNISKAMAIKSITTDSLDFLPGSDYNYSDVGYLLLGIVIDNITGSYRAYLLDVFTQLKMSNTYFIDQQEVITNQARGYSLRNDELVNIMRTWDYEIPSHFGAFSNLQDLITWQTAIAGKKVLNGANFDFLFENGVRNDGSEVPYACGWEINTVNELKFISHTGVTGTIMITVPQKNTTIILLTNLGYNGYDNVNPWKLAYDIINFLGIETKINRRHIASNGAKQLKA